MSGSVQNLDDWASDVAEQIVGDIPHAMFMEWAVEIPERAAMMLRTQLRRPSSARELNTFVEEMVRALPSYLPEQTAARLRAKLLGALITAAALGRQFHTLGTMQEATLETGECHEPLEKVDP
jgi:hypothetical protein